MARTVDCPYCEHENDMSDALCDGVPSDNKFDWECENCEKEFEVYVEFDPSYSASEIVIINCGSCGKETRDIYEDGRVFPFPKALIGKKVCRECWLEAYRQELDSSEATESA
ncbi:hypothetical protein PANG_00051 [Paenibacillus phage PG1]|uniref:hypothetical protein n=1 Tax=Paenibacillus phage PG1 TaxID=754053 RepID=UPI000342955C|nr:hypothetical protein PANG_00051 [Paenibacillus phage PG1]AGN33770.1 hypothetical protein PANG_00051 [Paenibacillus phage PG1]